MATPAFGFSVGDFISAISLVNRVRKSLKDAGGAASEYQSAVIELKNLATTLSHLEELQPDEDNVQHVNAIRAMAMACRFPLEEFRRKMTHYESSLGPLARRKSLHTIGQKVKWSVTFAEDVEKLRALIAAKHVSINLLLGMQTSKTLSKMNAEMRSSVQRLEGKIAEHNTVLHSVQERTQTIDNRIKLTQVVDDEILESIYGRVERIDHSVVQARHFGQQIMDYLNTFSGRIQGLLRVILQSNLQTYQLMLQMQQNISPRPTNLLESNIRFEDALGEIKELPYEYFRHWEPFEGFLRAHFKHKPGESKIINSQYYIIDSANKEAIIKKDHWTRYVREGATISMSMIMSYTKMQSGICPRPGCSGAGSRPEVTSNTFHCKTCSLEFFHLENSLEESFGRIGVLPEDEEVAKKQIAEDMSLYGKRPDPPDAIEVDEYTQLSNLPPKRSATEFDAAVNRPAKVRKTTESKEFNLQRVTAMDWNSGASPLDAWLNQSAVPSIVSLPPTQRHQSGFSSADLAAKELEELKVFRTIHIERIEEPYSIGTPQNTLIDLTVLEQRTQIYLRNIMDRYPLLPPYLALRLAKANCVRANRLDLTRHKCNVRLISKPVQVTGFDRPPPNRRWSTTDDVAQLPKPLDKTQHIMNPKVPFPKMDKPRPHTCTTCNLSFVRLQHLKRHERAHPKKKLFMCEQCTRSFTSKDLLLQHLQKLPMISPSSSSYDSRYYVTLNAPTALNRQADEVPVTYLTKGQDYAVKVHDSRRGLQSIGFFCYRTVFRISFEDAQQRQDPSACWQHWKEGRGLSEDYQDSGELQAVEYLGSEPESIRIRGIGDPRVKLETASLDSFSIIWSPTSYKSTGSCTIVMRFNFLSTDFIHSKGMEDFPVRLYAETQDLYPIASNPTSGPTAEICFCRISLLRSQGAGPKRLNDTKDITKTINKKEQHIACMEIDNKDLGLASQGRPDADEPAANYAALDTNDFRRLSYISFADVMHAEHVDHAGARENNNLSGTPSRARVDHRSGKVPEDERTWVVSSQDSNWRSPRDLRTELAKTRLVRSSGRPTSVLNVKGGQRDDPDDFPVSIPEQSRLRQQSTSRSNCMICSESDHPLEDCPHQQRESPNSRANAGFWTNRASEPRASSIHSQSSSRNSSLHGSGRLDPEDQDLSLPDNRSRGSSASFSESSTGFPPPPVYIEKERYPPAGGGKGILGQAPEPLRFHCDICEQDIEVLRRRDWQIHVLQDLQPYICTVEDCYEPTTQFSSRRSWILHEIQQHELEPGDSASELLERKLSQSATGACIFCGEQTGGETNSLEKHVGRHMEEIAFAVVRKPYEEWDFYSYSSGTGDHDSESDP